MNRLIKSFWARLPLPWGTWQPAKNSGFITFLIVWLGQFVSDMGSRATNFALGIWLYQQTNSVTQFGLIYLFTYIPEVLISPLAGALADRWGRRTAMILSNVGEAVSTLAIALLLLFGRMRPELLFGILAIRSACHALHIPAYSATITLLIPKRHFSRTSGMVQLSQATSQIAAPMLGGLLLTAIRVQGVLLLDFASFLVALASLLWVRFPAPPVSEAGRRSKHTFWTEIVSGWQYIARHSGLLTLLLFCVVPFFTLGVLEVLFTPAVLSFASPTQLGIVMSIGGSGWLLGSLGISAWGGPRSLIWGVLGSVGFQGACLLLAVIHPSLVLAAIGIFGYLFAYPIFLSCNQAIWQSTVEPDLQGRVFGVRRLVEQLPMAIAYLTAGPMVDRWLTPMLQAEKPLHMIAQFLPHSSLQGVILAFLAVGILNLVAAISAAFCSQLQQFEQEFENVNNGNG